ncbi:MAG: thiamine pyrophosphate-dependent enzyme [Candidatus Thermoplasmatota archaeon]
MSKFRCTVCNWVYDEDKEDEEFDDLPESFTCPVCGAPKSAFKLEGVTKESDKIETNVADKIVEQLEAFGVEYVYGIPGDSNLPLVDSIRSSEEIDFILTRHEETAAFMASARGKITGELGVCLSIAGPGSTNLVTGLLDAATDKSPVLALTGQVPEIYLGSESFQEIDQTDIFKPFSSYAQTIGRANQALNVVTTAVKYAYKDPGVSVLATPTDILVEKLSENIREPEDRLFRKHVVAEEEDIKEAAEFINESEKTVLFAGWGARRCGDLLMDVAEKINAPIATTSRAKGVVDETHPLSLGVLGSIGTKHATRAVKECDTMVIVGSGFRQSNLVPSEVDLVQIDIDPTRIGKSFDIEKGLIGDATSILQRMKKHLEDKEKDQEFFEEIEEIRKDRMETLKEEREDTSIPINPGYVIHAIKRNVDEDAIICVDVGDHTYWFYKKFLCEGQRTYMSANMASMGFSLPASLSAKIDHPDRQVLCVTGDGGFAMLMADFTTAVREELDINVILFNDGKLKNIKKEQERDDYTEYGVSFPNPNFAEFAEEAGGLGFRVEDPEDLDDRLEEAFESEKPSLVEVIVDPDMMAMGVKKID